MENENGTVELLNKDENRDPSILLGRIKSDDSELAAFYTGDFVNAGNNKISDFLFKFDKATNSFVLQIDKEIKYPIELVIEDDDFILVIIKK